MRKQVRFGFYLNTLGEFLVIIRQPSYGIRTYWENSRNRLKQQLDGKNYSPAKIR